MQNPPVAPVQVGLPGGTRGCEPGHPHQRQRIKETHMGEQDTNIARHRDRGAEDR